MKKKTSKFLLNITSCIVVCLVLTACSAANYLYELIELDDPNVIDGCWESRGSSKDIESKTYENNGQLAKIPVYTGEPYCVIADNIPSFTKEEIAYVEPCLVFESYSELDSLGRCGEAYALLGKETMPMEGEERGKIGMIKPSGWHTIKYECVDGRYLYNRCHLIGWQLSNENANELNLITGTRYLNVEGMLPFENEVAQYIRKTGNHILYRVTPIFESDNLVCNGLTMEAYSIEDGGEGVCFNVYCFNAQPGIYIDYATGESFEE